VDKIALSGAYVNFHWENLGDIKVGRPNLGTEVPVVVYRVFEYAMYDVLAHRLGTDLAKEIIRSAGYKAGKEFAQHVLNLDRDVDTFLADLTETLLTLKIGVLRVEKLNRQTGEIVLTIGEDLDCSGLPVTGEVVCHYDEGFLSGILEEYTHRKYDVREVDCWASGYKSCRFRGTPKI